MKPIQMKNGTIGLEIGEVGVKGKSRDGPYPGEEPAKQWPFWRITWWRICKKDSDGNNVWRWNVAKECKTKGADISGRAAVALKNLVAKVMGLGD